MSAPVNDNFADRILLTGNTFSSSGTTVDSTNEADESTAGIDYGAGDVWYEWVAPSEGQLAITVNPNFDGEIDIYTGDTILTLDFFDWTYWNPGDSTTLRIPVSSGVSYKIQVCYYSTPGTFALSGLFRTFPLVGTVGKHYAQFKKDLATKKIDLLNDVIKVTILSTSYVPDIVNHKVFSDVSSYQVSGVSGGTTLNGVTLTIDSDGNVIINAGDTEFNNVTFDNANYILLYDVTNNNSLIGYIQKSFATVAGELVTIIWDNVLNVLLEIS